MAINETVSIGNKYRRLKDASTNLWQRLSFWTKASDVEFDNGTTAETSLGSIQGITDSVTSTSSNIAASAKAVQTLNTTVSSFQAGVDTLYDKCVSLGVTPKGKALKNITAALEKIYNAGSSAKTPDKFFYNESQYLEYSSDSSGTFTGATVGGYYCVLMVWNPNGTLTEETARTTTTGGTQYYCQAITHGSMYASMTILKATSTTVTVSVNGYNASWCFQRLPLDR